MEYNIRLTEKEINEKIGECYALELMKEFQNETKD